MGWIRLDRQILDNWLWLNEEPFDRRSAWIDLLLLAEYEDNKYLSRGKLIERKRGEVHRSIASLAERWHWSRNRVIRYLRLLESDGMVHVKCTTHDTTITLENYGVFQDWCATNDTADDTTDGTAHGTAGDTAHGTQLNNITNKQINKRIRGGAPVSPSDVALEWLKSTEVQND